MGLPVFLIERMNLAVASASPGAASRRRSAMRTLDPAVECSRHVTPPRHRPLPCACCLDQDVAKLSTSCAAL